ncbi:MAG: acyltransferase [Eubacterium sp.]|nr:acyltransferase [Eubacterium sp.]
MRKYFIDNLRYGVVIAVIVYHIFYAFNSVGLVRNVDIPGIPALDVVEYVLYPWFMAVLFLVAGISARYALSRRSDKEFLKERVRKLLIPSLAVMFLLGWGMGLINSCYYDMFQGNGDQIPGAVKYLIYCFCGIGPLWFCRELFLCSLLLVLVRKLDQKDRLWQWGGRVNFPAALLLFFLVWGSSQILNMPIVEVYRNGIYLCVFFLGYAVFSHEEVQEMLERRRYPLLAAAAALGAVYVIRFWGINFAATANLKGPLVNAYAWIACLALLGCGRAWWNRETAFTRYMRGHSFGFFVLHNYLIVLIAWGIDMLLHPAPIWYYLLEAILLPLLMIPLYEALSRVPVVKRLLFGR